MSTKPQTPYKCPKCQRVMSEYKNTDPFSQGKVWDCKRCHLRCRIWRPD